MTVSTTSGNLPATTSEQIETGLEDMDSSDFIVPRLQIVTKEGKFKDGLSNAEFEQVDVVILGLVKQRIMWHPTVDEGDKPMCKSNDFNLGFPTLEGNPKGKNFPWQQSNFTKDHLVVNPVLGGVPVNTNEHAVLPCASCRFKDWDTHPNGGKPWCSEMYCLPVMYRGAGTDDEFTTALLTFKSSGISPTKRYLSSFARSKTPAFTALTRIGLTIQTRGDTVYSVPHFARVADTDRSMWPEYHESFVGLREFVRAAPRAASADDDDEGGAPITQAANPWGAAEQAVAQERATEAPAAPAQPDIVEAEIVPEPAPQAPPVAPVAPAPAPAPAPVQPPVTTPPPPAAPVAPVAAAPAPSDDDDLPF